MNWKFKALIKCDLNYFYLLLYSLFFLLLSSFLSPLFEYNTFRDVNIYNAIGFGIGEGKVLYKDLFDHKGPILYFLYITNSFFDFSHFFGLFLIEIFVFTLYLYSIYNLSKLFLNRSISFL